MFNLRRASIPEPNLDELVFDAVDAETPVVVIVVLPIRFE
jgi:hypothetical protein